MTIGQMLKVGTSSRNHPARAAGTVKAPAES